MSARWVRAIEQISALRTFEAVRSPTHARSLGAGLNHGFTCSFGNTRSDLHTLRTKCRIAHTLGIGGKVIDRFFRHTAALPLGWENRGELADSLNQFLNLAMRE